MTPDEVDAVVAEAAMLCKRFEGLYLVPYLCPAGKPTIGYGATYYRNGAKVKLSDPPLKSREEAERLLDWMLRHVYLPKVLSMYTGPVNVGLMAAMLDFSFNLGSANLAASTLLRKANAGLIDQLPAEFVRWIYAQGKPLNGLRKRRLAEVALFAPDVRRS